jgi:poly(3-hydroxyalkanoate) synthetase
LCAGHCSDDYFIHANEEKAIPVLLVVCGIMCFVALALTDSRTGIISMCVAVGLEVFLIQQCQVKKMEGNKRASLYAAS